MKTWLAGIAVLALSASAAATIARADGPRPSSAGNWPGMAYAGPAPAVVRPAAAPLPGPRPSSANNWRGMSYAYAAGANPSAPPQLAAAVAPQPATAQPAQRHWVWLEGYSHGGNWQGGWELVP